MNSGLPKVLFVDDDPNVLDSHRRTFNKTYDLAFASDGPQALDLVRERGPFQVVVTDLKMPVMDGIKLLKKIQKIDPDVIRVILTGYADLENAIDAVNQGHVFRFLSKPCPRQSLQTAIEAGLAQYELVLAQRELHGLRKLREVIDSMVRGFSRLVEIRDPYTAGHQQRVCELSLLMADKLGLSPEAVSGLKMAAQLHDIGKLYVPTEFLNKPGKLSEGEMSIIRTHPIIGGEILRPVEFQWPVHKIVLQHHERLDGSGYPHGLKGDEIMLEARILAAADVIDAMESHRPYRPSLGMTKARQELLANRAKLYDPKVVDACLQVLDELEPGRIFPGPGEEG